MRMSLSKALPLTAAAAGLILLSLAPASGPPTADAHSITMLSSRSGTVFVSGGGFAPIALYTDQGPSNRNWHVSTGFGLSNQDALHKAYFDFRMFDSASGAQIGSYGAAAWDWVTVGNHVFGGAIKTHSGGTFYLDVNIFNPDGQSQIFGYYAQAGYE